jgi:hypothetical protein
VNLIVSLRVEGLQASEIATSREEREREREREREKTHQKSGILDWQTCGLRLSVLVRGSVNKI